MRKVVVQSNAREVDRPPNRFKFFQAITLYGASDTDMVNYIRDHRTELDKLTGRHLLVILPKDVLDGNADWMTDVFDVPDDQSRYPGLRRSDLPCIWVEDHNQKRAIIRLPDRGYDIMALMRAVVDACEAAEDAATFQQNYDQWIAAENARNSVQVELVGEVAETTRDAVVSIDKSIGAYVMTKTAQGWFAAGFGALLILIILGLVFAFPNPSQFQMDIIRIVLSVAAAGFAVTFTGFLEVQLPGFIKAGGALAVFAIVYFYNPAARLADGTDTSLPVPTEQTDG